MAESDPARLRKPARGPERVPRIVVWPAQLAIFAVAGILAFLLRFDLEIPSSMIGPLSVALASWLLVKTLVFRLARLDRGWWRYFSSHDAARLCAANAIASALSVMPIVFEVPIGFPRSIFVLDFLLCTVLTGGIRLGVRLFADRTRAVLCPGAGKRVLIYGAGAAGQMLLREIRSNPHLGYLVQGFVDDDSGKAGAAFEGARVFGVGAQLAGLVREHGIEEVLIAIPGAAGKELARVHRHCLAAAVRCKTIPSLAEIVNGIERPTAIREIAPEQLLGRPANQLDEAAVRRRIEGKVVFVSGAAGSIGSELCRQIARLQPRLLVAFDIAESGLFHLDREIRERHPNVELRPEIGNIQNRTRLDEVMGRYRPQVVFHAAAYKHVPLMESHVFEAVENNIFGTCQLASAAAAHRAEAFVMISSDKAVRPTNVMGATKRVAEMVVQAIQGTGTQFVSVRFGNVLGSSGSVVPVFKEQIANGGPVRVTHREMRRYFMTIPEAVQLVLEASTMGRGGEVFVLDMGEPVKVVDLARNLILLSGLRPEEDIRIEFTGLRPGEKLYEETSRLEEETAATGHEKIKAYTGAAPDWAELKPRLDQMWRLCGSRDAGSLILLLKELVPDYNPDLRLLREHLIDRRVAAVTRASEDESLENLMSSVRDAARGLRPQTLPLFEA